MTTNVPTDADDATIQEFLATLEDHRVECVQNGLYHEAEVAQHRIDALRKQERDRQTEAIRARHIAERLDVEEAHMLEFESFNARWDRKMQDYDERTAMLEQAMLMKHQEELEQWQEDMQNQFLLRPKYSKEILSMRKVQEHLANARDYKGAQKLKEQADEMQKWELEVLKKDWRKKVTAKQNAFIVRQKAEQVTFRKRIAEGCEKQKRIRAEKLDRVLRRYQNIKAGLTRQQNLEISRYNEAAKKQSSVVRTGGASVSKMEHPRINISKPRTARPNTAPRAPPKIKIKMGTKKSEEHVKKGHARRHGNTAANNKSAYSSGFTLPDARSRLAKKSGSQSSRRATKTKTRTSLPAPVGA